MSLPPAGDGARPRPIVLVVLDGFGIGPDPAVDAIRAAHMPVWRGLLDHWPNAVLRASEDAVGLPSGQMGNSEVGHLNLGAGAMGFILPGVDNAAHIGGFAGGYLAGRLLDPLRPERIDHVVIGIACMVVSVLTILVPIVRAIVTILL